MELPNHLRGTMIVICRPMSATIEALLEDLQRKIDYSGYTPYFGNARTFDRQVLP